MGFGGATGLDYPAVKLVADLQDFDLPWLFPLLQALEAERLNYYHDRSEKAAAKAKSKG